MARIPTITDQEFAAMIEPILLLEFILILFFNLKNFYIDQLIEFVLASHLIE